MKVAGQRLTSSRLFWLALLTALPISVTAVQYVMWNGFDLCTATTTTFFC